MTSVYKLPPLSHVLIDRGQFVDDAGVRGPWLFFIDYVYEDGTRCTMNDVPTYSQAMADATELADEAGITIVDATLGGWLQ